MDFLIYKDLQLIKATLQYNDEILRTIGDMLNENTPRMISIKKNK